MTQQQAGQLRHRAEVWQRATSGTAIGTRGESLRAFVARETRYANFKFLSGRELEQARKVYAATTAEVVIRKPSGYTISTQDRIKFGSVTYGIGAVIPMGESFQDLQLLLFEVT